MKKILRSSVLLALVCLVAGEAPAGGDRVCILEFKDLTGDGEFSWLREGIPDALASATLRKGEFDLVDRGRLGTQITKVAPLRQACEETGIAVRYAIQGSFAHSGDRLRLMGRAVEVETGRITWPVMVTGDTDDAMLLVDALVERLANPLAPRIFTAPHKPKRPSPTPTPTNKPVPTIDPAIEKAREAFHEGDRLREQDKLGEAIQAYRRALDLDPNFPEAHNNIGISYTANREYDLAEAHFAAAAALQPDNARHHYNLGVVRAAKGHYALAVQAYTKAVELDPDFLAAYLNAGILCDERLGKLEEALTFYRMYLQRGGSRAAEVQRWVELVESRLKGGGS